MGSHSFYDLLDLDYNHSSNSTVIEIITSSEIKSNRDFGDEFAKENCDIYSVKY